MMKLVQADGLVLHVNPLQEALQPEGDTDFRGLLGRIRELCGALGAPVVVKEVGWGLSEHVVGELFRAGVAGVDVAGAGGTSWSEVERYRTRENWRVRVAAQFAGWGIPTAECVRAARAVEMDGLIIASGGIRDGVDAAKAIALGADLVGIAGPFLRAAAQGTDAARELAREVVEVLRIAMFSLGVRSIEELKGTESWCWREGGNAQIGRRILPRAHETPLRELYRGVGAGTCGYPARSRARLRILPHDRRSG